MMPWAEAEAAPETEGTSLMVMLPLLTATMVLWPLTLAMVTGVWAMPLSTSQSEAAVN